MRVAVVGHLEWVSFVRVKRVPEPGEIVHAEEWWDEPGGGGSNAAAQLAKLAGRCDFFTALGDDELGHAAARALESLGVDVHVAWRDVRTRRAITHVDADGERTITVLGSRLTPRGSDALPWERLQGCDAVYVTDGDRDAIRRARAARVVVATARSLAALRQASVPLDALVTSAADPSEAYAGDLDPAPAVVVRTEGARGGTYESGGRVERYEPAPLPGAVVDVYGAGDAFAAGLAYGLASSPDLGAALSLAARCGATVITGRGPTQTLFC